MTYEQTLEAAKVLRGRLATVPKIGIILGSGLGGIAEKVEHKTEVPYGELPHFAVSTAPGHKGQFVAGELAGVPVLCMQGRLHGYEGHDMSSVIFPIRVMKLLGIKTLIVTNAAGGVNLSFSVGDIMLIEDHINFTGKNPLIGENDVRFGPRFNDMTYAYSPRLRKTAEEVAARIGTELKKGVYFGCTGPSYETPAEIRAFRTLGADTVGMSTVPEVIAAVHCGIEVLAFSLVTNMAAGVLDQKLTEEEVLEVGARKGEELQALVTEIIREIGSEG